MRSLLATSFDQSWNMRSLLATSFNQIQNMRSLLATSFKQNQKTIFVAWSNMRSLLATSFDRSWYWCRSSWWQGLNLSFSFKNFLIGSSHFIVVPESKLWFFAIINPLILSSSIILLDYIKDFSCNDSKKTYMQWLMIRCHACIRT
jgi:hypothetical protein